MSVAVLKAVWGDGHGYAFVPRRKPAAGETPAVWEERQYKYPEEWGTLKEYVVDSAKNGYDVYWCPLLFDSPRRKKEKALVKTNVLWADLDYVNPAELGALKPSVAWKSSDERYQAIWFLDKSYPIEDVETTNRDLTYKIGADKSGWDVTQVLRVPGSPNYKYTPPQKGQLLWAEKRLFDFKVLSTEIKTEKAPEAAAEPVVAGDTIEYLIRGWEIPERTRDLLFADPREVTVGERSDRLWEIETSLLEAGMPILNVVEAVALCPWNKFKDRRKGKDQLYVEVMKADKHVKEKHLTRVDIVSETPKPAEEAKPDTSDSWAVPFSVFTAKHIEKPEWLVQNIWQKGTYGLIAGEPKTYKSVQATDLALSVASGRAFLNYFPVDTRGAVLYVQEENNEQTVQDRVFKIAASKGLLTSTPGGWALPNDIPLYFSNNCGIDLTQADSRKRLEDTIKELRPVLLILDPLYMMMGGVDENSAQEVGVILRWLTHLRNAYGLSIVVCHHYNKGGTGSSSRAGQRVRGSSAFHAWVESAIYVKATTELYTVKLEREFRAFPTMPELTLKLTLGNPGDLTYIPQVMNTPTMTEVSDEDTVDKVCASLAMMPRSAEEIADICKLPIAKVRVILTKMLDIGKVIKVAGSGRGRHVTYILA